MKVISNGLIDEIISYIEAQELYWDCEKSVCRDLKELIEDDEMPELYNKILEVKKRII